MKRFLNVFMTLLLMIGLGSGLVTPKSTIEATAAAGDANYGLDFKILGEAGHYKIGALSLDDYAAGYGSLNISYPDFLDSDIEELPLPGNSGEWERTSGSAGNTNSVSFIMNGSNSAKNILDFLQTVTFTKNSKAYRPDKIQISVDPQKISQMVDEDGITHYYTFVQKQVSWDVAYNTAKTMSYRGLKGYLATISSANEQDFIYNSIAKMGGWLGGTRLTLTDGSKLQDGDNIPSYGTENAAKNYDVKQKIWYWADGPEALKGDDAGRIFYQDDTYNEYNGPVPGVYVNWYDENYENEPNNTGFDPETVLEFAMHGKGPKWNDLAPGTDDPNDNSGFYVEYSEYAGQKETPPVSAGIAAPVTVHYVDENNATLQADATLVGSLGDSYTVAIPDIPAYRFDKFSGGTQTGTFDETPKEVTLVYKKSVVNASDAFITESEAQKLTTEADVIALNKASSTSGSMKNDIDLNQIKASLGTDLFHTYPVSYTDNSDPTESVTVNVTVVKDGFVFPNVPNGTPRPFGIYAQDASMTLDVANNLADQAALDKNYTFATVVLANGKTAAAETDGTAFSAIKGATSDQMPLAVPVHYSYTQGTAAASVDVKVDIHNGELKLAEVPTTFDFGTEKVSNTTAQYWPAVTGNLLVEDTRSTKAEWSLYVKTTDPIHSADNSLDGCLYYNNGTTSQKLSGADVLVTDQTIAADKDQYSVSATWGKDKNSGLNLVVPNDKQKNGTYEGTLSWTLVDAPAP